MTVDNSLGLEGSTFVAPKPGAPKGPAAPSPTTSRAVNGVAGAVEAVGQAELKAIETVDDVAKGEWGMPEPISPDPARPVAVPIPTDGAADSTSAPSEGGPAPVREKDPFPDVSPTIRVAAAVGSAQAKIKEKLDGGVEYDTEDKKQRAEAALSYDGTKPAPVNSASLKALLDIAREARGANPSPSEFYSDLYDELSRNAVVIVGTNVLTLAEFEKARQDAVTAGDQARVDQLDKGIYGFRFEDSPEVKQQKAIDQTLGSEIDSLKKQIEDRKANKQEIKDYEEILGALELAQTVEGDPRAFFQISALRRLRASGLSQDPVNLGQAIDGSGEIFAKSQQAIKSNAIDQGYTPEQAELIVNSLRRGDFTDLQRMGFFARPGVDRLIFGKELTDKEMAERLGLVLPGEEGRKYGKDLALMILLMALVGVSTPTIKAAMGELPRQR